MLLPTVVWNWKACHAGSVTLWLMLSSGVPSLTYPKTPHWLSTVSSSHWQLLPQFNISFSDTEEHIVSSFLHVSAACVIWSSYKDLHQNGSRKTESFSSFTSFLTIDWVPWLLQKWPVGSFFSDYKELTEFFFFFYIFDVSPLLRVITHVDSTVSHLWPPHCLLSGFDLTAVAFS